jgi:hypothetical protein
MTEKRKTERPPGDRPRPPRKPWRRPQVRVHGTLREITGKHTGAGDGKNGSTSAFE